MAWCVGVAGQPHTSSASCYSQHESHHVASQYLEANLNVDVYNVYILHNRSNTVVCPWTVGGASYLCTVDSEEE